MQAEFARLQLVRAKASHRQIYEHVRALIVSGQLRPGAKLPSSEELTALWDTHAPTIQAALAPLVKEGLLVRLPRQGTFVRQREAKLTRVGIYLLDNYNARDGSPFARSVAQQAQSLLHAQGIEPDVWVDPRPHAQQHEPWPELVRAAQNRRIQGLIVPQGAIVDWIAKLPIPWSIFSSSGRPNTVTLDHGGFGTQAVRALAKQGCRTIGYIGAVFPESANLAAQLFSQFVGSCRELGLEFRNEWVFATQRTGRNTPHEQQGYQCFRQLWSRRQAPEGLLIYPDHLAASAITALLELGVRVPAELKLALHKNRHIPLFCPVPATFLVSDEARIAAALIAQVQKQFRGEDCELITIPFAVESNPIRQPTTNQRKAASVR